MLPPSQVGNNDSDGAQFTIPPPDIKTLADDSARFIASVPSYFEKSIISEHAGTPEYSFLNPADPYHAYYRHRLSELRAQNGGAAEDGYDNTEYLFLKRMSKSLNDNVKVTMRERLAAIGKRLERLGGADTVTVTVASPFTGELIPASHMYQHMHYPQHREIKDILFANIRETTSARDDEISSTFAWLAETRPRVFGTSLEELSNAVKGHIQSTKLRGELIPVIEMTQQMQDDIISATNAWIAQIRSDIFGSPEEE